MITTRTIKPEQLTHSQICDWEWMVRSNPSLGSPFFRPEFTLAVARTRTDVRVIIVEASGVPVAFLPFQIADNGEHVAVGASLNDFQGVISTAEASYSVDELLRHAGVRRMFCPKVMDGQQRFDSFVIAENVSPFVDLSNGYGEWENDLKKRGVRLLKRLARKERKLIRDCGAVHFDYHTASTDVLQKLIGWKRNQYRRTNESDPFAVIWTNELLHGLLALSRRSEVQPVLSAMYAGKTLVAAHYCLAASGVCHSWVAAYNPEFARYSPGKLILRRLLYETPERGITRFDLGAGDEPYKDNFANSADNVRRVMVDRNPLRRWLRSNTHHARMAVKGSAFGPGIRKVRDRLRQVACNLRPSQDSSSFVDSFLESIAASSSVTLRPQVVDNDRDQAESPGQNLVNASTSTSD
jgi:CelD/BcsL family acetyltransferase involved in cellulose biosynthesis